MSNDARLRVNLGNFAATVTILDSTALTLPAGDIGTVAWHLRAVLVCRVPGVSGTIMPSALLAFGQNTIAPLLGLSFPVQTALTVDTTLDEALDVTWQWTAAHANNAVVLTAGSVGIVV